MAISSVNFCFSSRLKLDLTTIKDLGINPFSLAIRRMIFLNWVRLVFLHFINEQIYRKSDITTRFDSTVLLQSGVYNAKAADDWVLLQQLKIMQCKAENEKILQIIVSKAERRKMNLPDYCFQQEYIEDSALFPYSGC